jgi:dihydroneopterin aldolase
LPASDSISVKGLRVFGRLGVEAVEREKPQPLELDLELKLDLSEASTSDRLEDTVDYKTLVDEVTEIVSSTTFSLVEALAQRIADSIMIRPRVEAVTVSIAKLALSLGPELDRVRVRVSRSR